MCSAMREWLEEERQKDWLKGYQEGYQEGYKIGIEDCMKETIQIVKHLQAGYSVPEIARLCQCEVEVVERVKSMWDTLLESL